VGVLMIVGVRPPAKLLYMPYEGGHQVQVAMQGAQVVAGLVQDIERVVGGVAALFIPLEQEELRLNAGHIGIALLPCRDQLSLQDRARAVRPGVTLDLDVARDPGNAVVPWQHREAGEVWDGSHVGTMRPLPNLSGSEPGE